VSIELTTLLMFGLMLLLLASGLPIAFALGGCAVFFGILMWGPASVHIIIANASNTMRSTLLVAIPLFVFMAYMLERSGLAEDLYAVMYKWMGPLRGGLAAGTVVACTVVAAMSGISTTGVLLMGIIGLPSMLRRNYNKRLALGAILAGGALGPLIPPSVVMIVYALIAELSVGKLFVGAIIPGLVLSGLFIFYILIRCYWNPDLGPPVPVEERVTWGKKLSSLKGVVFPVILVVAVLGSIFMGVATPTEAAAVGAFGSIVSTALHRRLSWSVLREVSYRTLQTVAMVMWVIFAAGCFAAIYQGLGAAELMENLLKTWPVSKWVILVLMQCTWVILGCLMDALSILMISAPIFLPVAAHYGFDLLWFGILYAVNTEMGYLTPPFGVNLIVMKGIGHEGVSMSDIYQSVWPFVILQAIGLVMLILIPGLAKWLPNILFVRT
jgi:tripartite ATP-independent transporter DctM subunit